MAHQLSISLIAAMDHLWFHHIILLSEATSLLVPKIQFKPSHPTSESLIAAQFSQTMSHALSPPLHSEDEEKSADSSALDDSNKEAEAKEMDLKERPTRMNIMAGRARSYSSSPLTQKRPRNFRRSGSMIALPKSTSCRSLWELELKEVKGFMDLGFIFKKEHLNPRMMSVVPGLQRVGLYKNKPNSPTKSDTDAAEIGEDDEIFEQEEYEKGIMRPYLSEAWLIKRPDSPLLNLRIPRVMEAADMKKHLKFWAKTVASEVQQEC